MPTKDKWESNGLTLPLNGNQPKANPSTPLKIRESAIVRTLRTVIPVQENINHTVQGPVWAMYILLRLIILLRTPLSSMSASVALYVHYSALASDTGEVPFALLGA